MSITNDKSRLDQRSGTAKASDKFQEELAAQRQRVFSVTLFLVVIAEVLFWYLNQGLWLRVVVPIMWVGLLIHNNALLILHELWELNDQVSGRKDEFRQLLSRQKPDTEAD